MRIPLFAVLGAALALCAIEARAESSLADRQVDLVIESRTLAGALDQWAQQSGINLMSPDWSIAERLTAPKLKGKFRAQDALDRLLEGTPLTYAWLDGKKAVKIHQRTTTRSERAQSPPSRVAQLNDGNDGQWLGGSVSDTRVVRDEPQEVKLAIPEVLVEGSRILNADIARSRDDVQPYVVFDRKKIADSGAKTVEDFLRKQLTTTTNSDVALQNVGQGSSSGAASSINLRGLGTNQTLILVDGHRVAGTTISGNMQQPDINGIPLSAIERIEVLSTTASGIYGGSATGGVINIVLRRDYSGIETSLTYGGSFDGGATNRQLDLSAGFNLEDGKTNILIAGSYHDADALFVGDRDFMARARARVDGFGADYFPDVLQVPVGTTTNIESFSFDDNFNRLDLTLKDGTPLNSPIAHIPVGYAGVASDGGAALVATAGHYNLALADTAQANGGAHSALLGSPKAKSANITVRREFSPSVQAFVEFGTADDDVRVPYNGANNAFIISQFAPNNPFQQDILVATPGYGADGVYVATNSTRRAVGGVIVRLPHQWQASLDYAWSKAKASNTLPGDVNDEAAIAVGDGTLDVLRDTSAFPVDFAPYLARSTVLTPTSTTMKDTTLRFAGPFLSLPAGNPVLSLLLEHRDESFGAGYSFSSFDSLLLPSIDQSVESAYLEAKVPLISERNDVPGVHLLDLQVAGRWDEYTIKGAHPVPVDENLVPLEDVVRTRSTLSSTNPTIGLRYMPVPDVMFRGSYSKGFLPPTGGQLSPGPPFFIQNFLGLTDPRRGGELLGGFVLKGGGNEALRPERSESWSAGIVLTPRMIPDLRISADWTRIKKKDNIASLALSQSTVDDELLVPGLITRDPPDGGPFDVGPINTINLALLNVARTEVEALDLALDYQFDTDWGGFLFTLAGTRLINLETQTTLSTPVVENVGVSVAAVNAVEFGGGLDWKANASLTWSYSNWKVGWATRYFDSYWLSLDHSFVPIQGSATVPSQVYHDAFVSWNPNLGRGLLSRLEVQLGVQNVFNESPPVDVVGSTSLGVNQLGYSQWGDPRLASYYITVRTGF
ncbi:MAG TPA: TonB-dependent receptor [Steroidobacteraceae bacterium]|jgi:outer membrane receptor protein involved in Fe transport